MKAPLLLVLLFVLAGCEDPKQDMGDQPKYNTYRPGEFFADGMSQRQLVNGVVAREEPTEDRAQAFSPAGIRNGQENFNIFCATCHGRLGNGEGMIVQRGLTRPPSFHVDRLKKESDQHFYDVISNGFGAMYSYNDRIAPQQRWEIVAYVRALQIAPDVGSSPQLVRDALIAKGDRPR